MAARSGDWVAIPSVAQVVKKNGLYKRDKT